MRQSNQEEMPRHIREQFILRGIQRIGGKIHSKYVTRDKGRTWEARREGETGRAHRRRITREAYQDGAGWPITWPSDAVITGEVLENEWGYEHKSD